MNNVTYFMPGTLTEAVEFLNSQEDARIVAGGTDLIVKWKKSKYFDMKLVDIRQIKELKEVCETRDGFFIGAGVTMAEVNESAEIAKKYHILAEAAGKVGSVQIRNMATIGGNTCNAAPSADTVLPLIAYGAEAVVLSKSGEWKSPLKDFFTAPGKTILQPGEMLKGFLLPNSSPQAVAFFVKHTRRAGMDLSTVGLAMVLDLDENREKIKEVKIVIGAAGPLPIFVKGLDFAVGKNVESEELPRLIADQAAKEASPIININGSGEYRDAMVTRFEKSRLRIVRGSREYRDAMIRRIVEDCFEKMLKKHR